jgi:hypothetical protein
MIRELSATVSPFESEKCLWLSTATRARADMGSPCVPVMRTVTLSDGVESITGPQQDAVRNLEQSKRVGDLCHGNHAAADHGHPAAHFLGEIEDELDAVDGRAETRHHHLLLSAVEHFLHARADSALALGVARAVGIGRVGKQQQDTALAVVGKGVEVE